MKRIAVLFGGCSSEYEVSLQSAYAVISNIDRKKYEPVQIGISRKGDWYLYEGVTEAIVTDTWQSGEKCYPAAIVPSGSFNGVVAWRSSLAQNDMQFGWRKEITEIQKIQLDAAFPVLHGKNGEDGTVQGMLKLAGIPVIGCGTLASALCMDKDMAHRVAAAAGVKVPKAAVVTGAEQAGGYAAGLGYPLFVKPLCAGSSFGITKVMAQEELKSAVTAALRFDSAAILEEMIEGFEVGCAVLGTGELIAGAVDEIELSQGFFDYVEKYTLKSSKIHVPARISKQKAEEIKETAKILYQSFGCSFFARVDLFLTPDGSIYFNEVNTIPGFTEHSRYPGMMKAAGMTFPQMINRFIELAVGELHQQ